MPSLPSFFKFKKASLTTRQFVQFEKEAYLAGTATPNAEAHLSYKKGGLHVPIKPQHGFRARRQTDRNLKEVIKLLREGASDGVFGEASAEQAITALQALRKQKHFNKEQLKNALDPVSTQKLREAAKAQAKEVQEVVAAVHAGETVEARPHTDPVKKSPAAAKANQETAYGAVKTWTDVLLYECAAANGKSHVRSEVEWLLESRLIEKTEGQPAVKGLSLANMQETLLVGPQRRLDELMEGLQKEMDLAAAGDHSQERHQRICNCCELLKSHIAATIDRTMAAAQLFANQLPQADFPFQVQQMLAQLGRHLASLAAAYADRDGAMMQTYRLALDIQASYQTAAVQPSPKAVKSVDDALREVALLYRDFERLCLPPAADHGGASEQQEGVFNDFKQGLASQDETGHLTPAFVRKNLFDGIPGRVKLLQEQLQALIQRRDPQRADPVLERKIQDHQGELRQLVEREIVQLNAVGALLLKPLPGLALPPTLARSRQQAGEAMQRLARRMDDRNSAWRWMVPRADGAEAARAEASYYDDQRWMQDLADLQDVSVNELRDKIEASPRRATAPQTPRSDAVAPSGPFMITTSLSEPELKLSQIKLAFEPVPLPAPPRPASQAPSRSDLPRFSLRQRKDEGPVQKPLRKRQDARAQLVSPQHRPRTQTAAVLPLDDFLQRAFTPVEGTDALNADQLKVQAWLDGALKQKFPLSAPQAASLSDHLQGQRSQIEQAQRQLKERSEASAPAEELLDIATNLGMLIDTHLAFHAEVARLLVNAHAGSELPLEWAQAARQAGEAMLADGASTQGSLSRLKALREQLRQTGSPAPSVIDSPREPEVDVSLLSPRSASRRQSRIDMQNTLDDLKRVQANVKQGMQAKPPVDPALSEFFGEMQAALEQKVKKH